LADKIAAGGKSKESPQARPEYYPGYYATWVLDPDGHDIKVVHKSYPRSNTCFPGCHAGLSGNVFSYHLSRNREDI